MFTFLYYRRQKQIKQRKMMYSQVGRMRAEGYCNTAKRKRHILMDLDLAEIISAKGLGTYNVINFSVT